MEVENVTWISFTTRRTLQDEGNLTIGDGLFGKVIENDKRVLALVHEPFADGAASIRSEVLVHCGIRSRGRDDGRVFHRASIFQRFHDTGDVGLLLADGDVDAIERLVTLELALLSGFVLLRLRNDGIHRDGGLACGTVANDKLTLAATNRDHGIDAHDAGLDRNGNGFTGDDARSQLLDGILGFALDFAFAVNGLAECVDHASEEALADWHGKQASRCLDFVAGFDAFAGAKDNAANFGLFEVERQAEHAAGELDHFIEHDVAKAFDLGCAVTDLADHAHVGLGDRRLESGDFAFDFLEDAAHGFDLGWDKMMG